MFPREWLKRDGRLRPSVPYEHRYVVQIDGCWRWIGGGTADGYGLWKKRYAHRVAWERANGPVPSRLLVCHACNNKWCVNPGHLYLATIGQNTRDAARDGLLTHGDRHPASKLRTADIPSVWRLRSEGLTQREIAERYGVSRAAIRQVLDGKTWRAL